MVTCGIDWAEAHHDVALVNAEGKVLARSRIGADVGGFSALLELIAEHGGGADETPIAIETDKNLLVVALAGAASRSTRSTPGQWLAIASGTRRLEASPILAMRWCWRTSCEPISTCIDRCRRTASTLSR
jgi:hypothetical protein